MSIYEDADCTGKVSSEGFNPADDGYIEGDDYTQYFERTTGSTYYIKTTMNDGADSYSTCGNPITANAGDTVTGHNIVVEKEGVAFNGMNKVGIDLNQDSADDAYTEDFDASMFYRAFTLQGTDTSADVNYYDGSGLILTLVDDLSAAESTVTNNIARVVGVVPSDFDGDTLEIEHTGGDGCGGASIDTDKADTSASPWNYYLYFQADGSSYDVLFCDGTTLELSRTIDTTGMAGGEQVEKDVSKFYGEAHPGIEDSTSPDNIAIYETEADCRNSADALSSESEQPADNIIGDDYEQFYETKGAQAYYMQIDKDGAYKTCLALDGGAAPAEDNKDLSIEIEGKVQADISRAAVDTGSVLTGDDAFTTDFSGTPGQYYLYTTHGTGLDTVNFYDAANAGNLLLTRGKDMTSDKTVNVGKVSGETHTGLYSGTIEVWDTIDTNINALSSETASPSSGTPDYEQYFEADPANPTTTSYYIKAATSDGMASRGNSFMLNAGYAQAVDLEVEKTGKTIPAITKVAVDHDENGLIDGSDAYTTDFDANNEYKEIGRASLGKECRSRWSPYH